MEHQRHSDDQPVQTLSAEAFMKFQGSSCIDDLESDITRMIHTLSAKEIMPSTEQIGIKFHDSRNQPVSINATLYPQPEDDDGEVRINVNTSDDLGHELHAPYGSNFWRHTITSRNTEELRRLSASLNSYQATDELSHIFGKDILPLEFRFLDKEPSKRDLALGVTSLHQAGKIHDAVSQTSYEIQDYEASPYHLTSREIKLSVGHINTDTIYKQLLVRGYLALNEDRGVTKTIRYYQEHDRKENIQKAGIRYEVSDPKTRFLDQSDINSHVKEYASVNGEDSAALLTDSLKKLGAKLLR